MVGISKKFAEALRSIKQDWNHTDPDTLADRITNLMNQASNLAEKRAAEHQCFEFAFGSVREFKHQVKRRMLSVAREVLKFNSLEPLAKLGSLEKPDHREGRMSPEGTAHAIQSYVDMLEHQVRTAEAFFFGRLGEGMEGLLKLPEGVREKVDALLLEKTKGEPLNAADEEAQILIAAALVRCLEEGMGY